MPRRRRSSTNLLLVTSAALLALAGCRDSEQGRPLSYEPGVYQGAPDQPIDEETRQQLRDRAQYQSFN